MTTLVILKLVGLIIFQWVLLCLWTLLLPKDNKFFPIRWIRNSMLVAIYSFILLRVYYLYKRNNVFFLQRSLFGSHYTMMNALESTLFIIENPDANLLPTFADYWKSFQWKFCSK